MIMEKTWWFAASITTCSNFTLFLLDELLVTCKMHLSDPGGFPITAGGGENGGGSKQHIVLFRTTRTIPLTGSDCISCHQAGGDQIQADFIQ